ncbi:hypothetical protein ACFW93_32125 [Streptomyces canus]|uniref:hypothetical protein n=1 Tax=Streptomyces canus TaxID=58343 RepID=UPI0036BF5920
MTSRAVVEWAVSSPVWLSAVDIFTGERPQLPYDVHLDVMEGASWVETDVPATRTPHGAVAYPRLGRVASGTGVTRFRVRFGSDHYLPVDPPGAAGGIEFSLDPAHPVVPAQPQVMSFAPTPAYPYPPAIRTLYGRVTHQTSGAPAAGALVAGRPEVAAVGAPWPERAATDADGRYVVALRWAGTPAGPGAERFELLATTQPPSAPRSGRVLLTLPPGPRLPAAQRGPHAIEIL